MPCLTPENLLYPSTLRFTATEGSGFCVIVSYACTYLDLTSSKQRGQNSVSAHAQLSHVYLTSTLDVMHMIKYTRLSPSLAGRACERGYVKMLMFGHYL